MSGGSCSANILDSGVLAVYSGNAVKWSSGRVVSTDIPLDAFGERFLSLDKQACVAPTCGLPAATQLPNADLTPCKSVLPGASCSPICAAGFKMIGPPLTCIQGTVTSPTQFDSFGPRFACVKDTCTAPTLTIGSIGEGATIQTGGTRQVSTSKHSGHGISNVSCSHVDTHVHVCVSCMFPCVCFS